MVGWSSIDEVGDFLPDEFNDPILDALKANLDTQRQNAKQLSSAHSPKDARFQNAALNAVAAEFMLQVYAEAAHFAPHRQRDDKADRMIDAAAVTSQFINAAATIADTPIPDVEAGRAALVSALEKLQQWHFKGAKGKINFTPTEASLYDLSLKNYENMADRFLSFNTTVENHTDLMRKKGRLAKVVGSFVLSTAATVGFGSALNARYQKDLQRPEPNISAQVDEIQAALSEQQKLAQNPDAWTTANSGKTTKEWGKNAGIISQGINTIQEKQDVPLNAPLRHATMLSGIAAFISMVSLKGSAKRTIRDIKAMDEILPQLQLTTNAVADFIKANQKIVSPDGPAR